MNHRALGAMLAALSACGSPEAPATPADMVYVPGGMLHVGDDGEVAVRVAPFFLDAHEVTVAQLAAFVAATGHVTRAEREGSGKVFDLVRGGQVLVAGARWSSPYGPGHPVALPDQPATQVSWSDASAFCGHAGKRLPTELEVEHALRNGRDDRTQYPWGDTLEDARGRPRANVWQGELPRDNTLEDGYLFAAPVGRFEPTPLGLYDLVGNVWEWTSSPFETRASGAPMRAIRGGSFLCEARVCHGYRTSARQGAEEDGTFSHVGFRCARDARAGP